MTSTACFRKRSGEILKLVADHGPVTIDMLSRMTEPPMPKKNLRYSLALLRRKALIEQLSVDPQMLYYQISQAKPNREAVAAITENNIESLAKPLFRRQEWFHNQWCEYWALSIKRLFPEAQIIREHSIAGHELAKCILQTTATDFELLPDFLLVLPKTSATEAVHIAFEIERTRKSNARIIRKLKKYLNGTLIDGLVYICDTGRLSETIRELYETKLVANAHRVKHYGDHFFMFSDSLDGGGKQLNRFFNAKAEPVLFDQWCMQLRKTKRTLRRDKNFRI
jgi:predicted transcriptional regulator